MKKLVVLGICLLAASPAMAGWSTGVQSGPYNSNGPLNDAVNGVFTMAYGGPEYLPGGMTFEGDITSGGIGSYLTEARLAVKDPSGHQRTFQPFGTGTTWTGLVHCGPVTFPGPDSWSQPTIGTWEFRFYESYDDGGTTGVDATWTNVNFTLNDWVDPAQNFVLGTLTQDPVYFTYNQSIGGTNNHDVYHFTLPTNVANGNGSYLNIQTLYPGAGSSMDTEIGLFDANGICVATDDDGQVGTYGLYSMLSHGDGDPYFNADTPAGIDGALLAGDYTLVVAGYNTSFTIGGNINAVTWGTSVGDYQIQMHYMPEPGTLALLGLGLLGLIRRR